MNKNIRKKKYNTKENRNKCKTKNLLKQKKTF